ncbi:MAG: hypothetical protein IKB38_04575 [Clostridia bacterium]|nr:hypothetical protein [Clostridia bacterium]
MSTATDGRTDLAGLVSAIMEHPELIEQISRLAGGDQTPEEKKDEIDVSAEAPEEKAPRAEPVQAQPSGDERRSRLLCALKPYLSDKRARAIDSMLTFGEIFDMMKAKK